ncbi:MAG: N-acyl homoserine lactonase family protein [Nitrososphaeria archaeon]
MAGKLKIIPLLLGEADVDSALDVFWGLAKEHKVITVPILSFLVMVDDKPLILVDTGFRSAERVASVQRLGPHRTKPEWDLIAQLRAHGADPRDIKYVILTHLHYDHAGRLLDIPNAQFIVQRRELMEAAAPRAPPGFEVGGGALFYDRQDVSILVDKLWDRLVILDGDEEIVPGVKCVLMRDSHTPGSQAVYVELERGRTAIIAGDIVRNVELNVKRQVPPALFYDLRAMQDALAKIKRDGEIVLPSHDYEIYHKYSAGVS